MNKKKLDPVIAGLLAEPVGASLLKALKLQYLSGIATFKPQTTAQIIERIYHRPVPLSKVRARLRRLADNGYLKRTNGGRFRLQRLFLGSDMPFYQRRTSTYRRHLDAMIWLSIEADDAGPVCEIAAAALRDGGLERARALLVKLVDTGDRITRGQVHHSLAVIEAAAGRPAKARFYFREAFQQGARAEFLYVDYARFKAGRGDLRGAIDLLKESLQTCRDSSAIHDLLAEYYDDTGDAWRSEYHRFRATALDADFIPVKAGVADQLRKQGAYLGAIALYKEAARERRRHCYALYRHAYLCANALGDLDVSLELFRKILRRQPDDTVAASNIAKLEKRSLPLVERIECLFARRKMVWNPDRPGVIEIVPQP